MNRSCYIGRTIEELRHIQEKNRMDIAKELAYLIICGGLASYIPNPITFGIFLEESIKIISNEIKMYDYICNSTFYKKNSLEYIKMEQSYRILLEEILKLFASLNWDNEMKILSGYSYLLRNGYLSHEHKFYYTNDAVVSYYDFLGSNIVLGIGDCKHINSMLTDLLVTRGYTAYNLSLFSNDDTKIDFLCNEFVSIAESEVNEEKHNYNKYLNWLIQRIGNHAVTLYTEGEYAYIMDALNNCLFYIKSDLSVYQGEQEFNAFYNSFINRDKKNKLANILKPTSIEMLDSRISDYQKVLEICPEYTDVFEKFYQEHRELYQEIISKRKILIRETQKNNELFKSL